MRLGRDKESEVVGNRSLLTRVIDSLDALNCENIIVISGKKSLPSFIVSPELRVVEDIYPGKGALGGIYTGLTTSDSLYNLVVACDMPFLNLGLLRYMI